MRREAAPRRCWAALEPSPTTSSRPPRTCPGSSISGVGSGARPRPRGATSWPSERISARSSSPSSATSRPPTSSSASWTSSWRSPAERSPRTGRRSGSRAGGSIRDSSPSWMCGSSNRRWPARPRASHSWRGRSPRRRTSSASWSAGTQEASPVGGPSPRCWEDWPSRRSHPRPCSSAGPTCGRPRPSSTPPPRESESPRAICSPGSW